MKPRFNNKIKVGKKLISKDSGAFLIGEIGSNHNQSLSLAKELIDIAHEAGLDAVKFQSLKFEELYLPSNDDLKSLHKSIDFNEKWYHELFAYCKKRGLVFLSSPTYLEAVEILEDLGAAAYKIASPQTVGFAHLIKKVAKTGKPLFVSTGYCTMPEVRRAVSLVSEADNKNLVLLHCISKYPTPEKLVNLRMMDVFRDEFSVLTGFSDHTMSTTTPALAFMHGARVIEKHFTLDRKLEGPDHCYALEPDELKIMASGVREAEVMLGNGKRILLPFEKSFKKKIKMKIVAARDIKKGETLAGNDVVFRRAQGGIEDFDLEKYIGRKTASNIAKMSLIKPIHFHDK